MTPRPTSVEPVKPIFATSGCSTSRCPTTRPGPTTTLTTPSGIPASRISSASRSAESGVSSAGLRTTVFPQASAGPSFQLEMFSGKFHGTIRPDDAERLTERHVNTARHGDGLAVVLVDRARVEVEDLRDHADLGAGAGDRLADVLRLDPRKLLRVLLDERREPPEEPRPVGGSDGAPFLERRLGASDRRVGLLDPSRLELGDRLLSRRVGHDQSHLAHLTTAGSLASRCPTAGCPTPGRGLRRQSPEKPPAPELVWFQRAREDRPARGSPTDGRDRRLRDSCSNATRWEWRRCRLEPGSARCSGRPREDARRSRPPTTNSDSGRDGRCAHAFDSSCGRDHSSGAAFPWRSPVRTAASAGGSDSSSGSSDDAPLLLQDDAGKPRRTRGGGVDRGGPPPLFSPGAGEVGPPGPGN